MTSGSPVHADEPDAVFTGYIIPDASGQLPTRVRAVALDGTACGSARVLRTENGLGWYALSAVGAGGKAGCPVSRGALALVLLAGPIDDGVPALAFDGVSPEAHALVTFYPGAVTTAHLRAMPLP